MEANDRVVVSADVMARQLGDDCVMLDLASGTYFGLDPVGARVWQLLQGGKSLAEVCDALAVEYDAAEEVIRADVFRLVEELAANGLVVPA